MDYEDVNYSDTDFESFTKQLNQYCEDYSWTEIMKLIDQYWVRAYGAMRINDNFLELITGGWSDNEQLIKIIEDSFFWFLFWQESHRGGYYKFKMPKYEKGFGK